MNGISRETTWGLPGVLVAAALLSLLPANPAQAAFPGANGKIAFVSNRDGNDEIYAMAPDGTGQTRVTSNAAADNDPVWSPDGSRIAFRSDRDGNAEIYVMNANGTGQTRLTNNLATDQKPTWSPDGTRMAFWSDRDGNPEIYVMNADGTGQLNLSNNAAADLQPAWSPAGNRIAFWSDRDGNLEIYAMNADGTGQARLTNDVANDEDPAFSPDGTRLVFNRNLAGNNEVYVMNADGTGQTRLTNSLGFDGQATWSPDGNRIAFLSTRDGNLEIYFMNADGSGQARLTSNPANDSTPDWQRTPSGPAILVRGFEGTSYLDNCAPAVNQCFRPPTPSGAIGTTQFLEANNGSVAIYDKATGGLVQRTAMPTFWSNVGLPGGANGDQRVLFDHFTNRWIISSFGPTANTRNLAISDSNDALGTWKSVRITMLAAGGTADAGTLSVDEKAVYIATNNFTPSFAGTSLLTIPKADLFNGSLTLANMTTFNTPFGGADRGFLIQVATNWQANPTNSAAVIAASRDSFGLVSYRLNGVGAAGATQTTAAVIPGSGYSNVSVDRARQPDGTRLVQLVGGSITASAVQRDGLVFATSTVRSTFGDFAAVRWTVVAATTGDLRSSGLIEQAGYDFYQGTIAINASGEVVIAYNRSGTAVADGDGDGLADGNISLLARTYYVDAEALVQTGSELRLRVSGISDYHCGERTPVSTLCTQRWGYWAALTVDPVNPRRFYALGAYASQWAVIPGPTTTPRAIWNTYIAEIEPPSASDTDGDGVLDFADNCTLVANNDAGTVPNSGSPAALKSQLDADQDGYGNLCDGDLNNSTLTTAQDNTILRNVLNQAYNSSANAAKSDMNGSGLVTAQDNTILRNRLNTAPGPSGLACAGTIPCP